MGSPKTRPTVGQRWPRNAEKQRKTIYELAGDGQELIVEHRKILELASSKLIDNPAFAELLISRADTVAADLAGLLWQIQLQAEQARKGVDPPATLSED